MNDIDKQHPVLYFIFRHWVVNISVYFFIGATIIFYVFYIMEKQYTAETLILPSAADRGISFGTNIGKIADIAGFGMSGSTTRSQEMYEGILTSTQLLERVLFDTFAVEMDSVLYRKRLIEFLEIEGEEEREIREKAFKEMREEVIDIGINVDNRILALSVTLSDPFLSAVVCNRMVNFLDEIVQKQVQKEYHEQHGYLRERISQTEDSLKIAENKFKYFLETIKNLSGPKNQIQELRLRRNLEIQTLIYGELRKQMEIFALRSMIDLSSIKVLDNAEPPFRKSRPKRLLVVISLGILAGCIQIGMSAIIIIYRKIKYGLSKIDGGNKP